MIQIFLAHASEDKDAVIDLYNRLKARGFKPWLDKVDLLPGQSWRAEIPKAIRESDVFIACLSKQSVTKQGYVQKEFRIALQEMANKPAGQIYVIPLRLDDCQIPELRQENYGINFIDYQWLNFFEHDGFEQLVKVIEFSFPNALNRPKSDAPNSSYSESISRITPNPASSLQPSSTTSSLEEQIIQLRKALESLATRLSTSERTERNVFIFNNSQFAGGFAETVQGDQIGGIINNQTSETPSQFAEDLSSGITLDMVYIPGGRFLMGSPEEEADRDPWEGPQHKVKVTAFYMGKYPVTQQQWQTVSLLDSVDQELKSAPSLFKGNKLPVEMVSWNDAVEFCKRLSRHTGKQYRLPSEAEWEYACRAGTLTPFYVGNTINTDQANFRNPDKILIKNHGYEKSPMGKYPPNDFGLFDMHGNVNEWCQDSGHMSYKRAPEDSAPWISNIDNKFRVLRGGSCEEQPSYCRSAARNFKESYKCSEFIGFRVVCSISHNLQR